jgi:hypothetical protein
MCNDVGMIKCHWIDWQEVGEGHTNSAVLVSAHLLHPTVRRRHAAAVAVCAIYSRESGAGTAALPAAHAQPPAGKSINQQSITQSINQ